MTTYIELSGGLGNQLFQIAFSIYLRDRLKHQVLIDVDRLSKEQLSEIQPFLEYLGLTETRISFYCHKFPGWRKVFNISSILRGRLVLRRLEDSEDSLFDFKSSKHNLIYQGYAQNKDFAYILKDKLIEYLGDYDQSNSKKIIVHIRRGDMESNPKAKQYHGLISLDWLLANSIRARQITSDDSNSTILIHSDSEEAGAEFAEKVSNSCFVDSKNMKSFDVLRMMRGAQAYVLSNSTLGWWAAFLSMPQQVFAPLHWFAHFDHPMIRIDEWTWN